MFVNKRLILAALLIAFPIQRSIAMGQPVGVEQASSDKFILDSYDNLDDMRKDAGKLIESCKYDLACFESAVRKYNPDVIKKPFDNKINMAYAFGVERKYKLIHLKIYLVSVVTVDGVIKSFDVNWGVR